MHLGRTSLLFDVRPLDLKFRDRFEMDTSGYPAPVTLRLRAGRSSSAHDIVDIMGAIPNHPASKGASDSDHLFRRQLPKVVEESAY